MNDHPEDGDNVIGPAVDNERKLELFGEIVKIEHRRLDEQNKRTELAGRAFGILDQKDRRQTELATKQLEADERADVRRHKLVSRIVWTLVATVGATGTAIAAAVALVFFGTPEQSEMAVAMLKFLGIAGGGFGVGHVMLTAMRRLLRH